METNKKMSFGLRIISEVDSYFVGLDLGQSGEHSALALVERAELLLDEMVSYLRAGQERRYRMRFPERLPLGTPYPMLCLGCARRRTGRLRSGERESHSGGVWHVPKRDLITGLRVMLENRELGLPAQFGLTQELRMSHFLA